MKAMETRTPTATTNGEEGRAHGALAGCVKVVTAFNAALSAGVFALAACWGFALPAAGCLAAFAVSLGLIALLRGGRAA